MGRNTWSCGLMALILICVAQGTRSVVAAAETAAVSPASQGDAGSLATAREPSHPNVVIIIADQWRAQATGFAGDPNARTPQLDQLAKTGVVLTTAASTCPVCSPFRASLVTGRYPTTHGVFLNDVPLNNDAVSLAQAFRGAGYTTGFIGKWHIAGDGRLSFIPPELRQGFEFWRACECTHDYNRSLYYGDTPEPKYWKGYDAEDQTREAEAFIRSHQKQPFLLVLSWGSPHNPYNTAPEQFKKLFKPEDIKLRPNVPAESANAARRDLAGYYAHCAALDTYIGDITETLSKCGLDKNTIIVFTSDHGDMLESHAMQRKQRPWDESALVPFVVHWPTGLGEKGRKLAAPFASPEIMPTLLSLCDIPIPKTVEGANRADWLLGKSPDADRDALICAVVLFGEWTARNGGREYRGIRTIRYTYVRTLEGPWLLYDNQEDTYQEHNLIGNSKYAGLQAELDGRLKAELKRRNDEFLPAAQYMAKWGYDATPEGTPRKRPLR